MERDDELTLSTIDVRDFEVSNCLSCNLLKLGVAFLAASFELTLTDFLSSETKSNCTFTEWVISF
jgi:hypothetical protein